MVKTGSKWEVLGIWGVWEVVRGQHACCPNGKLRSFAIRSQQQPCGAECHDRGTALACGPWQSRIEWSDHLRTRWTPVPRGGRGRQVVHVCYELAGAACLTLAVDGRLNFRVLERVYLPVASFLAHDDEASCFLARRENASSLNIERLYHCYRNVWPNKPHLCFLPTASMPLNAGPGEAQDRYIYVSYVARTLPACSSASDLYRGITAVIATGDLSAVRFNRNLWPSLATEY